MFIKFSATISVLSTKKNSYFSFNLIAALVNSCCPVVQFFLFLSLVVIFFRGINENINYIDMIQYTDLEGNKLSYLVNFISVNIVASKMHCSCFILCLKIINNDTIMSLAINEMLLYINTYEVNNRICISHVTYFKPR